MEDYKTTLRCLALRDDRYIASLLADERESAARSGLDPWTPAELPVPPSPRGLEWLRVVGPGVIVLGLSIGSGEFLLGPAVFVRHGLTLLWITAVAVVLRQVFGFRASFLPPEPAMLSVQVRRGGAITGRFAFLFVTTLEKLLLSSEVRSGGNGPLKFVAVEQNPVSMLRAFMASLVGRLGRTKLDGVHVEEADEIAIEGEASRVILDGETFRAGLGKPILLKPAPPLSFVRIAA